MCLGTDGSFAFCHIKSLPTNIATDDDPNDDQTNIEIEADFCNEKKIGTLNRDFEV